MPNQQKPEKALPIEQVKKAVNAVTLRFHRSKGEVPIVTLCGSTSFKSEYRIANRFFTINGFIVLSVGGFHHIEDYELTEAQKSYVDMLHLHKIQRSDLVFVIDRGGYVGRID